MLNRPFHLYLLKDYYVFNHSTKMRSDIQTEGEYNGFRKRKLMQSFFNIRFKVKDKGRCKRRMEREIQ